jgi:hypothetical protein
VKVKPQSSHDFVKQLQWFAHKGQINSINFLENPDGIITCSTDKHVKLWSLEGILWGDINLMNEALDKQWSYPLDWSEKKENEILRVKTLMNIIDYQRPEENVKEEIVFDH